MNLNMSKYIDAEKLIDEIERFSATEYGGNTFGDDVANGALDYVLEEIIPSLQQEQPSFPPNLDEAELKYVESMDNPPANQEEERIIYQTFKAGSEWAMQQLKGE
jgi:hypothetical protein